MDVTAIIPQRATEGSAGYDLSSKDNGEITLIPAHGKAIIMTGLQSFIPEGCYGRIAPRSGMSWENHTMIAAGVVDRDYEGELGIVIFNHGGNDLEISPGERVAQFILERCETPPVHDVRKDPWTGEFVFELVDTFNGAVQRGKWGFGSTGRQCHSQEPRSQHQLVGIEREVIDSDQQVEVYKISESSDENSSGAEGDIIVLDHVRDARCTAVADDYKRDAEAKGRMNNVADSASPGGFLRWDENERSLPPASFPGDVTQGRRRRRPTSTAMPSQSPSCYRHNSKLNPQWNATFRRSSDITQRVRNFFSGSPQQN